MASRFVDHAINFENAKGPTLAGMRRDNGLPVHYFSGLQSQCLLSLHTHEGGSPLYNIAHSNYVSGAFPYTPRTPIREYRRVAGDRGSLKIISSEVARYYRGLARCALKHNDVLYVARKDLRIVGAETHHTAQGPGGVTLYKGRTDTFFPLMHLEEGRTGDIASNIRWETLFDAEQVYDAVIDRMKYEDDPQEVFCLFDASVILQKEVFFQE